MADLFASLVLRSSGQAPLVRPQIAPMFAPLAWTNAAVADEFGEAEEPLAGPRRVSSRRVAAEAQATFSVPEPAVSREPAHTPRHQDPGPLVEEATVAAPPRAYTPAPAAQMQRAADVARPAEEHRQAEATPAQEQVRLAMPEHREAADHPSLTPQGREARRTPGQPVASAQAPAFPSLLEDAVGDEHQQPGVPLRVAATERSEPPLPAPGQPVREVEHWAVPTPSAASQVRNAPAAAPPHIAPVERGGPWPAEPANGRGRVVEGPGVSAVVAASQAEDVVAPQPALRQPGAQGAVSVALPVARDATTAPAPLANAEKHVANDAPDASAPAARHAPVTSLMPALPVEADARDGGWAQPAARGQLAAERQRVSPVETAAPVVHVTIGRVEVRMVEAQAAPATRQRPTRAAPQVTLEEYLRRRDGAGS